MNVLTFIVDNLGIISTISGAIVIPSCVWLWKKGIRPALGVPGMLRTLVTTVHTLADDVVKAISQNRNILEQQHTAAFEANQDGEYQWATRAWSELFGIQRDDARGDGWTGGIHLSDRDRVFAHWDKCVREQRPFKDDFRTITGARVSVVAHPVHREDRVIAWQGTVERLDAPTRKI